MEETKSKAIHGLESITQNKQKFSVNVLVFKELSNSSLRFEGIEIAVPLKELQWQFLHCCICCN
jgi:Cu2+-containing amine oxidase